MTDPNGGQPTTAVQPDEDELRTAEPAAFHDDGEAEEPGYAVTLPSFHGPLDLLLTLARRSA